MGNSFPVGNTFVNLSHLYLFLLSHMHRFVLHLLLLLLYRLLEHGQLKNMNNQKKILIDFICKDPISNYMHDI